ncbi:MAG: DNRLRE domain-containing protein [Anaerolineae bacterium]|nr:DNRLRE domain-containing protein [Anaerolineae bacterium]
MKRLSLYKFFGLLLTAMLLVNTSGVALSAPGEPSARQEDVPWTPVVVYFDPAPNTRRIPEPESYTRMSRLGIQTADLRISFLGVGQQDRSGNDCIAWPAGSQAAFEYAVGIWETLINSSVPIEVVACWTDDLPSGVLGQGGADYYYADFSGAPQAGTLYPTALANALHGSRIPGSTVDMHLSYASGWDWYFGTDGNPGASQIDMVSIVLHETGHGLGFAGSMIKDGSLGYWGYNYFNEPAIYDRFTETGDETSMISRGNGTVALGSALTSEDVFFDGPHARAAFGGNRPELFAPPSWMPGSSYSHLDESFNDYKSGEDSLMTWSFAYGESVHAPGPVTLGIMQDVGWTLQAANTPPTLSGIPDLTVPMNQTRDNAIDLWQYAADAETPDSGLDFEFVVNPPAGAGISIDSEHYIDVNPNTGYVGNVPVEIQVADTQGLTATATFQVNITDENFAPVLDIPNVSINVNGSASIDLWNYASDPNDLDNTLVFTLGSSSPASLTVDLTGHTLDITPETDWAGTGTVEVTVGDPHGLTDTDTFEVYVADVPPIYLPIVFQTYPPIPGPLTLNAISNSGSGSYNISWSSSVRATTYLLQEDDNAAFSSPITAYSSSSTSTSLSGRIPGTYYYRVRGVNADGNGPWSNIVSARVMPPRYFDVVADTNIFSSYGSSNYGNYNLILTGYNKAGCNLGLSDTVARGLIRFDLSGIPTGTPVASAVLNLSFNGACIYTSQPQARTALIHRVASPWTEMGVTWNSRPTLAEQHAAAAFSPTSSAWIQFNVTSLVQTWVNNPTENYGAYIIGPETSGNDFALLAYDAREGGSSYSAYLDISYAGMAQQEATRVHPQGARIVSNSNRFSPGAYRNFFMDDAETGLLCSLVYTN